MQCTGWVAQLSLCVSQSVYVCVDVISLMSAKNEFTSVSLLLFFTLVTKILQLPQSCPLLWVKNLKVQVMLCSLLVLSLCSVILLQLQHCCCFSAHYFHSFFSLVSMAFLFFPKKSDTQTALRRPISEVVSPPPPNRMLFSVLCNISTMVLQRSSSVQGYKGRSYRKFLLLPET